MAGFPDSADDRLRRHRQPDARRDHPVDHGGLARPSERLRADRRARISGHDDRRRGRGARRRSVRAPERAPRLHGDFRRRDAGGLDSRQRGCARDAEARRRHRTRRRDAQRRGACRRVRACGAPRPCGHPHHCLRSARRDAGRPHRDPRAPDHRLACALRARRSCSDRRGARPVLAAAGISALSRRPSGTMGGAQETSAPDGSSRRGRCHFSIRDRPGTATADPRTACDDSRAQPTGETASRCGRRSSRACCRSTWCSAGSQQY